MHTTDDRRDPMLHDYDATRRSWNHATRNHNAHKGDQAARLRAGEDTLFDEELDLLGPIAGRDLVHLQCNAGQDTLCLARRGANVLGVDLSDEAIAFARKLAADAGIERPGMACAFDQAEVVAWMGATDRRFDVAFTSYGATGWLPDLGAWARGVHRLLRPGGVFATVEFHPLIWSFGRDGAFDLRGDDYFQRAPFHEPVGDYVATSGAALGATEVAPTVDNPIPATSWQHGLGELLTELVSAGLRLERVVEWPYANGCKVVDGLVPLDPRRWGFPAGIARVPLMYGIRATRP